MTEYRPCARCARPISTRTKSRFCRRCSRQNSSARTVGRTLDCETLERTWRFVIANQPVTLTQISQVLYGYYSQSALLALEANGYLLSEDDRGKYSAFRKVG